MHPSEPPPGGVAHPPPQPAAAHETPLLSALDAAAAGTDLPFETGSLIRLIRGFLAAAPAAGTGTDESLPDVESAGALLWDLCGDEDAAPVLLQLQLLPAVAAQLTRCLAEPAAAAPNQQQPSAERVLELCCGMLANLHSLPVLAATLAAQADVTALLLQLLPVVEDPPALSELCRLLTAALATPEVRGGRGLQELSCCSTSGNARRTLTALLSGVPVCACVQGAAVWLPQLQQHERLAGLVQVVANTLHAQLLERALQLVAALLAAARAADGALATPAAAAVTGQAPQQPQAGLAHALLELGLLEAVSAVLGHDDDGSDRLPPAEAARMEQLRRQTPVLAAAVDVMLQLGEDPGVAAAALRWLPGVLPELLLRLLVACIARDQHTVAEQLLLVLVQFRSGVLPWLGRDNLNLEFLAAIASVLRDADADSLDAQDAAWFLLAAATRAAAFSDELQAAGGRSEALDALVACVAASRVPESAQEYARVVRQQLGSVQGIT
jgi:hypothetical protein